MALVDLTATDTIDGLDREARDIEWAVDRARRNPWFGGDVLEPAFRPVLSAIVAPRQLGYGADLPPGPAWDGHRSAWADGAR